MTSKRTDSQASEGKDREPIDDGFASDLEWILDVTAELRAAVAKDPEWQAEIRARLDESARDRGPLELR